MVNNRVLFVDDEPHVLDGIRRNMRKIFSVHTATGPEEGLKLLAESSEPFAVIVSDMRMPGMNGVQFLAKAKVIAPESIRLMLTGNADQETAVTALNKGEVFKFLNKPCEQETLEAAVKLGIRQYELITAEKELLSKTVKGSIEVIVEILALSKPLAFGRVERIRRLCQQLQKALNLPASWELDAAALLSQLGCVSLSEKTLEKVSAGEHLYAREMEEFLAHPQKGFELINKIPRLEKVANIVAYQFKNYDGSGIPANSIRGNDIPHAARILRVVMEFDEKKNAGFPDSKALESLQRCKEMFDPALLSALERCVNIEDEDFLTSIPAGEIRDGMILVENVVNDKGILIACRGLEVTPTIREHLIKHRDNGGLTKKITVRIPAADHLPGIQETSDQGTLE